MHFISGLLTFKWIWPTFVAVYYGDSVKGLFYQMLTLFCPPPANGPWEKSCCQSYMYILRLFVSNVKYMYWYILLLLSAKEWNIKSEHFLWRPFDQLQKFAEHEQHGAWKRGPPILGFWSDSQDLRTEIIHSCKQVICSGLPDLQCLVKETNSLMGFDAFFFIAMVIDCTNNNSNINTPIKCFGE